MRDGFCLSVTFTIAELQYSDAAIAIPSSFAVTASCYNPARAEQFCCCCETAANGGGVKRQNGAASGIEKHHRQRRAARVAHARIWQ